MNINELTKKADELGEMIAREVDRLTVVEALVVAQQALVYVYTAAGFDPKNKLAGLLLSQCGLDAEMAIGHIRETSELCARQGMKPTTKAPEFHVRMKKAMMLVVADEIKARGSMGLRDIAEAMHSTASAIVAEFGGDARHGAGGELARLCKGDGKTAVNIVMANCDEMKAARAVAN